MGIFQFDKIAPWLEYLAKGTGITLLIAVVSAVLGLIIGIVLILMSKNKVLNAIAVAYIDLFRGTPLLLQLAIVAYAIPQFLDRLVNGMLGTDFDFSLAALLAVFITFSLNSGAYLSEVLRSGINSVNPGELEAAHALGISKFHTFKDIILPTAFKNSFPALMNEFITLIKETSIVGTIGIADLFRRQQIVTGQTYLYLEALIVIGVIYYTVIKVLSIISRKYEEVLSND